MPNSAKGFDRLLGVMTGSGKADKLIKHRLGTILIRSPRHHEIGNVPRRHRVGEHRHATNLS